MYEGILKSWRIIGAIALALVLVGGAYLLSQGTTQTVAQAATETALLKAIATKDSTGDGLPDWEKQLYGIPLDATTTDYFHLGMTDGEAVAKGLIVPKAIADVPVVSATSTTGTSTVDYAAYGLKPPVDGTLSSKFGETFFVLYLAAKEQAGGQTLSDEQVQDLSDNAMTALNDMAVPTPDYISASNLKIAGSGSDALRSFAADAEGIFVKNADTKATKSDLQYLDDVLEKNDTEAANQLARLATSYRVIAAGLAMLPVPAELASDDLTIVNSLMRLGEIYSDFSRANTDPLAAMIALKQYRTAEQAAEQAFVTLAATYTSSGVLLKSGEPGARFVNVMNVITAAHRNITNTP